MPAPLRFPKYDLGSAIEAARTVRARSADGRSVSPDELAVFLGYKSTANGAYMNRVAALKLYGLLEGRGNELRLTDRALMILEPDLPVNAERARLEAFFDVPLFGAFFERYGGANRELPDDAGMRHALHNFFGIDEGQAPMALARLLESADEAGLFRVAGNRSKMIRPTLGSAAPVDTPPADPPPPPPPPDPSDPPPTGPRSQKVIDGVLDLLPPGRDWDEPSLLHWLRFFEDALRMYYKLPKGPSPASSNGTAVLAPIAAEGGGP